MALGVCPKNTLQTVSGTKVKMKIIVFKKVNFSLPGSDYVCRFLRRTTETTQGSTIKHHRTSPTGVLQGKKVYSNPGRFPKHSKDESVDTKGLYGSGLRL